MMSTTGRIPVMAAPTATAVKPASEIGVSRIRSGPNSLTNPVRTLKGWPASAMSSPKMKTRESRRSSSASASRMASPRVNSRVATPVSGIHVLPYFVDVRIGSGQRELHAFVDLGLHFGVNLIEIWASERVGQQLYGIAAGLPLLLFLLRSIIFAADIADVMAHIAIGVDEQERRALAFARATDEPGGGGVDRADVLSINAFRRHAESRAAQEDVAGGGFRIVRVLVVQIVFANVDHC